MIVTAYASLWPSGMLDSTALMSWAPNPVAVRLCFGRVNPGPTGPCKVEIGAPMEGLRSLGVAVLVVAMMSWIWRVRAQKTAKTRGLYTVNEKDTKKKTRIKLRMRRNTKLTVVLERTFSLSQKLFPKITLRGRNYWSKHQHHRMWDVCWAVTARLDAK